MRLLIAIVLSALFVGVAYSTEHPNPKPTDPKTSSEAEQRGSDNDPITVKILPAPDAESKATQEEKYRKDKSVQDEKLADATERLVWITGVLAFFTACLWWATYRLAKDAKRTADRQASEMQNSLLVAQESADAAKNSVALAREEFIATNHPRIIIRRIRIYQASDVPLEVHYELANVGGTSAKIIEISARLWLPDSNPNSPIPPYATGDRHLGIIVESGSPYQGLHRIVLTEEIEEYNFRLGFAEGTPRHSDDPTEMFFFGYIVYLDQLDRRFETAFLRHYNFSTKRFSPVNDPDYEYLA